MRLTHRDNYGRWFSDGSTASLRLGNPSENYPAILWGDAVNKLAEYEDTGLSPEEFKEKSESVLELYGKLKPYADAEEQGRLVILPCKVGDTVFVITERGFIAKGKVCNFRFFDKLIVDVEYHHFGTCATSRYWGETVFLTREEAEATLKGNQDEK